MTFFKRKKCRACDRADLLPFLELGPSPLANSFLNSPADFSGEVRYPLDVCFCRSCSLVQIADVVDPEILFRNYIYVTGTSETIVSHNKQYARTVADFLNLGNEDLIVEIASNNGNLLKCFQNLDLNVIGIEPAENIAKIANDAGVRTVNKFFNSSTAKSFLDQFGSARVVIGNNVLAHVDETQDFLEGCKLLISDDGLVVIEVPYLKEFVEFVEYDTVYHEHLCYFSVTSLLRLCDLVGLSIIRIDKVQVHGGSIRIYAGKKERFKEHSADVLALADEENKSGLTNIETYLNFAEKVKESRKKLIKLLEDLKKAGKTVAAYGAPAKGNTLLNYCGIGTDLLAFTVDRNPLKVGLYTPGAHLPVLPVSAIEEHKPDYLLILAWNFATEIIQQQRKYQANGGKFIIPIPEPRIVEQ